MGTKVVLRKLLQAPTFVVEEEKPKVEHAASQALNIVVATVCQSIIHRSIIHRRMVSPVVVVGIMEEVEGLQHVTAELLGEEGEALILRC